MRKILAAMPCNPKIFDGGPLYPACAFSDGHLHWSLNSLVHVSKIS